MKYIKEWKKEEQEEEKRLRIRDSELQLGRFAIREASILNSDGVDTEGTTKN